MRSMACSTPSSRRTYTTQAVSKPRAQLKRISSTRWSGAPTCGSATLTGKQPSNAHHVYVTTYNTAQVRHLQQITQYQYPDVSTKSFTENFKSRGRRTMKLKKASVFTRPRNLTQAERAEVQALAMEEENWTAHLESALAESGQPVD